jgi:trigger factor
VIITQGEVEERQTALHIELDDDDLEPYIDRGYKKIVNQIRIPGFRPGKAPRRIVENAVGREGLLNEVLEFFVPDVIDKAIEAQKIDSVGLPHIEKVDFDPVVVDAKVALDPVLDLGDYRSIRIEEDPIEVSDEEIDTRIEDLRKVQGSWEPVERAAKFDDLITMTVTGVIDEAEILNETDSQYIVDPDSQLPFPGFAAELEGLKVDEPSEFTLEVPDDYPDNELIGKEIKFSVTVSDVKERVLPDIDDEFAKSVGDEYETVEQLREQLREDVENEAQRQNDQENRETVIEELVLTAEVEIAPLLIEHEIEHMEEHRDELVQRMQISLEDYYRFTGKTAEQIREEMHEQAIEKLSRSYALSAFIERESLEIDDDELDERLKELAREGDEEGRKLTNKELRSERVRNSVRESLLVKKAVDWLMEIASGKIDGADEGESEAGEDVPAAEETKTEIEGESTE